MNTKKIIKTIKKYHKIVIARHVGADPDALASSIALKEIILKNFPKKEVLVIGNTANKFKYFGSLDKLEEDFEGDLLIVTDTPDIARIDGTSPRHFKETIKIDHHPFVEQFGKVEWIDTTAASASQMIIELVKENHLKIDKDIASKLYLGVVADTDRFLHNYTTTKTFNLVSWLIKETDLDFTSLYEQLYMRSLNDIRFIGYIASNLVVTEHKLGYIKLDDALLKQYNVDASTAGNLINRFSHIEEVLVMVFCSEDTNNKYVKASIRSRGPIINEIATHFNGGGHVLASGARPKDFEEADKLISELDQLCAEYLANNKNDILDKEG